MVSASSLLLTAFPALASSDVVGNAVQASAPALENSSPVIATLNFAAAVGTIWCNTGAMAFMRESDRFIDRWQQSVKNRLVPIRERYALSKTENWLVWGASVVGMSSATCLGQDVLGLAILSTTLFLSQRQFAKARAYAKDLKAEFDAFMQEDNDRMQQIRSGVTAPSEFSVTKTEFVN